MKSPISFTMMFEISSSARRKGADHGACESGEEKGPATKGETNSKEAVKGGKASE